MNRYSIILLCFLFGACQETGEMVFVPDNTPPPYSGVHELTVMNFINRAFIDLIGREALDSEMEKELNYLQLRELHPLAIDTFLLKLQQDTTERSGGISYRQAWAWQLYVRAKARIIEGEADDEIAFDIAQLEQKYVKDSLLGNEIGMSFANQEILKLQALLKAPVEIEASRLSLAELHRRMIYNEIYDEINMGSFNYVNATFDDLFFRFPTDAEFEAGFDVIEYNRSRIVLGENCQSKREYAEVLTNSREFHEACIQADFLSFLGRRASHEEMMELLPVLYVEQDYEQLQRMIMITEDYAGF
ncbi:MAG: hypothetical protein R8P61_22690 [Bacteroidia bacterium]|nr:hypothetical protein [Bacteroidia bacterium]